MNGQSDDLGVVFSSKGFIENVVSFNSWNIEFDVAFCTKNKQKMFTYS